MVWRSPYLCVLTFDHQPFQAIPFVRDHGPSHFGFSDSEVALLCGSHSGEESHVAAVSSMLSKIDLSEQDLRCGVHLPIQYGEDNLPLTGSRFDQRHNNCSGKHTGFLRIAVCTVTITLTTSQTVIRYSKTSFGRSNGYPGCARQGFGLARTDAAYLTSACRCLALR